MWIQLIPPLVVAAVSVAALVTYPTTAVITLTSVAVLVRWLRKTWNIGLYRSVDALYAAQNVLRRVRAKSGDLETSEVEAAITAVDRLIERLKSTSDTFLFLRGSVDARYSDVLQAELYVKVMQSGAVQEMMKKTGASEKDVVKILRSLSRSQSSWMMTIMAPILRLAIRILFPLGIQVSDESIERLRSAVLSSGGGKRKPVLLLPCHKSHVDYMIVHLLAMNYGLPVPLCIAGDNLNMPVIGSIFQKSGAVFIRRSFSSDLLYQAVFKEHTLQLLRQGHLLECFIEGGRSRSGKLLPPKIGFLKSVVDPVLDGDIDDVTIVPISISYDRILEAPSHLAELTGGVKTPERFLTAVHTAVNLLHLAYRRLVFYGRVDVSVAGSISVKDHFASKQQVVAASSAKSVLSPRLGPKDEAKTRNQLALSLGFKNQHCINEVSTILPTMLVGTVLLFNGTARALRMEKLVEEVTWLSEEIQQRGGRVHSGGVEQAVNLVVDRIMGMGSSRNRLVKKHKSFLMTGLFTPLERMELATYRNSLIHVFIIEALLCAAFQARLVAEKNKTVSVQQIREDSLFLSALLKLEFIFRPGTLEANFNAALETLERKGVFRRLEEQQQVELLDENSQLWKFLLSLVAPFVDAYYVLALTAMATLKTSGVESITQSALVSQAQTLAEKMFFEEEIDAYEAIAKDTLQNAVSVFIEDGSLELVNVNGISGDKPVRLKVSVDDFQHKVDKIRSFRLVPV